MNEALDLIGIIVAAVAVAFAWKAVDLVRREREEGCLRALVEAVLEVRRTASEVFVAHDLRRDRLELSGAAFAFRQAQDRLRLALASGGVPGAFARDHGTVERLNALLDRRPLTAVKAAGPLLDATRRLELWLGRRRPALPARRSLRWEPMLIEPLPRPSGGCAAYTCGTGAPLIQMVVPAPGDGLVRRHRAAGQREGPWNESEPFATDLGPVDAVSMCAAGRGSPESLEVIARTGGRLHHLSLDAAPGAPAGESVELPVGDADGVPAIIQSAFGNCGNLEVVTPARTRGLIHLWRDNDAPEPRWRRDSRFAPGHRFEAVSLIHGDLHDHLELIARSGHDLHHLWRTNAEASQWHRARMILADGEAPFPPVAGCPGFLHVRTAGSRGNFEVVAPLVCGGFVHMWRDNDHESHLWRHDVHSGSLLDAAGLVERGRPGGPRRLTFVARGPGGTLQRDAPPPGDRRPSEGPGDARLTVPERPVPIPSLAALAGGV
jgi:hypothetical protein